MNYTRLLLMAALAASPPTSGSCTSEPSIACALAGCSSMFYMVTVVDLPFESVEGATYRACRNGDCHTLQLDRVEPGESAETSLRLGSGQSRSHLIVAVVATDDPGLTELRLEWNFDGVPLTDRESDQYEVTIESDGETLYSTTRSVSEYLDFQPNGPLCEPTCYQASIRDYP